jgi:hypothetical protein
MASAP